MNAEIIIKIGDYENITFHTEGTAEEIITQAAILQRMQNGGFGLEQKEWNRVLDSYLKTKTMTSNDYDSLSKEQMFVIQELKKSFKRIVK